jgi:SAM-dependent methyltransferase
VEPTVLALLRCPHCRSIDALRGSRRLDCTACGREFQSGAGYADLLDIATRGEPTASSTEQRFMESELVARIYERFWRPTFVRVMAGSGAAAQTGGFHGEFFIHKNSLAMEERPGPWLDLSCGPGVFTRAMAAAAPGAAVVGLDISRPMLEVASKRVKGYGNVTLIRGDAHELPFADASFAGINNASALHIYDDPEQVFREAWRVLKPTGLYVGSTFSEETSLFSRAMARLSGIRRYDPPALRAWLSRVGFADYEDIRLGGNFIFRVRKP